jgi:hypothetical protein
MCKRLLIKPNSIHIEAEGGGVVFFLPGGGGTIPWSSGVTPMEVCCVVSSESFFSWDRGFSTK